MSDKKLRERCLVYPPEAYEISCDICGGNNITWSEFEHQIWCYDCQKDTSGNQGIFGGPIPVEATKIIIGPNCFDEINIKTGQIFEMSIEGGKIIYKEKLGGTQRAPENSHFEGTKNDSTY